MTTKWIEESEHAEHGKKGEVLLYIDLTGKKIWGKPAPESTTQGEKSDK
jgi:hypothetical protein